MKKENDANLNEVVKELCKKYNKKRNVILVMIKECFKMEINVKTTKIFIEEFLK